MALNLKKLEAKLDKQLAKETAKSLSKWLLDKRKKMKAISNKEDWS